MCTSRAQRQVQTKTKGGRAYSGELLFREVCGSPTVQLPRSLSKIQAPGPTELRDPESEGGAQPLICNSSGDSETS